MKIADHVHDFSVPSLVDAALGLFFHGATKFARASRGFSEVGRIAPQVPVGRCLTIRRRALKRLLRLLRAPRAAGIAEQSPLPLEPSIRGSIFWILNSRVLYSPPFIAASPRYAFSRLLDLLS